MVALLLAALDQTIIATALPTIGRELGDLEHLPWVVTSYLLTSTAVTPLYGKFSDAHGRRITIADRHFGLHRRVDRLRAGAQRCSFLILARGLQGLGGGGLIALAQTIVADLVPPRERGRYQVYFASVFMTSSLLGPVLGGFFAEHLHWSMIFWINIPLGLLALFISYRGLKTPAAPRPAAQARLARRASACRRHRSLLLALSWGGIRLSVGVRRRSSALVAALARALGLVRLAHANRRRAADSRRRTAQPSRAHGRAVGLLRHGHLYRPHDLPAGLFRDRSRLLGEPFGSLRSFPSWPEPWSARTCPAAAWRR